MSLSAADVQLVRAFAAAVLGRFDVLRAAQAAFGAPDRRWREMLLQVHVFAGFPRLVEVYALLEGAQSAGSAFPEELEPDLSEPEARARGRALFERIYQADAEALRTRLTAQQADFARWIEEHAYGRVLARPGLGADRRELLAVAALAALGQERQLASHVRGALRCGATRAEVDATLDALADFVAPDRCARASSIVEHFARPPA